MNPIDFLLEFPQHFNQIFTTPDASALMSVDLISAYGVCSAEDCVLLDQWSAEYEQRAKEHLERGQNETPQMVEPYQQLV